MILEKEDQMKMKKGYLISFSVTMDNIILQETLKPWREKIKSFVRTDESRIILEACINNQVIIIRGAVGSGKSITTYHAAFNLETSDGYSIFPSNDPENIKQHTYEDGRNIFIFDDIFGKYVFNNFTYDRWKKSMSDIIIMLDHNVHLKIIITSRSNIPMPVELKQMAVRSRFEYQLFLSSPDKEKLAEHFCGEFAKEVLEDSQYTDLSFFPCICKEFDKLKDVDKCVTNFIETELTYMKTNDLMSYITLGLLVVLNNLVCKTYFENECTLIKNVLSSLIKECKSVINITPFEIENVLYHMKGTYILENEIGFTSKNTYMFDCLALCVGKEFCGTILKHSDDSFFRERLVFTSVPIQNTSNTIPVPITLENSYFERVLKMFEAGHVEEALKNVQSSYKPYRLALIQYLQISSKSDQSANYMKALPVCLKLGYTDVVDHLISSYPFLANTTESYEEQPLNLACEYEQYDCVEVLIKHEADVNKESNDFLSPLHIACQKRNKKIAELLIKNKADINMCSRTYGTPMSIACNYYLDELDLVQTLVNNGADINERNANGSTPLHEACANRRKNIVRFLLQQDGIKINGTDSKERTPLVISCQNQFDDIIDILLMNNASVNKADDRGFTPLHIAASGDFKEIAQLLLKNKASINQTCKKHFTPLTLAAGKGSFDMVQLFLKYRADINGLSDIYRETPLYAAYKGNHINIAHYLLQQVREIKSAKYMFLFTACLMGDIAGVDFLLQKKKLYDLNYKKHGDTALCIAARKNYSELVKLLLNHKPDVNVHSRVGWTPLCSACKNGNSTIVELLISHKASLNQPTKSGMTPLFISCVFGHVNVTRILLKHRSTIVEEGDKHGWTPLKVSCFTGTVEMVELLLKHKAIVNQNIRVRWKGKLNVEKQSKGRKPKMVVERCRIVHNYFRIKQTPLCISCWKLNEKAVKFLIENGADINQGESNANFGLTNENCEKYIKSKKAMSSLQSSPDINELTPLQIACYQNKTDVIQLLVSQKAALNMFTPKGIITKEKISYTQLEELMKTNRETLPSVRPLIVAITHNKLSIVKMLLEYRVDINMPSRDGLTPLHLAVSKNATDIVILLLNKQYRCQTIHYMHDGLTPLLLACSHNNFQMVNILIQHGATVNQVGEDGQTALQYACEQDNIDIVKLLLDKGAEICTKGQQGPSPLDIAKKEIHEILVKYNTKVKTATVRNLKK